MTRRRSVINDWFLTAHEAVLHGMILVAASCYVVMIRDIAAEVRG